MASNDETRAVLEAWDVSKTDTLKEARAAAVDAEDEKNVRNDEERLQLERRKLTGKLCELAEQGDKDALKIELLDIPRDKAASYRDDRGNNVLHVATMHGKQDVVSLLVEEFGFPVNAQDAKGWTPIAIAAFHGYKKVCQVLMTRKADPLIENAYRKDAFAVAKDDEIRDVLKGVDAPLQAAAADLPEPAAASSSGADAPEPEAKAKAKGKAKASSKSAGGKSKAKAKSK